MKAKLSKLVVVAAMLAACSLCLGLAGCGGNAPQDPNLGVYEGTVVEVEDETTDFSEAYSEGENYLTIDPDGECMLSIDGKLIPSKYVINGENITVSFQVDGESKDSPGTIADGQVTIDFCGTGVNMIFVKKAE